MDLSYYREQIDQIDDELIQLFARRMETAAQIAQWKRQAGKPVMDAGRERAKLLDVMEKCPEEFKDYAVSLYSLLFELSRSYQHRILDSSSALTEQITAAVENTDPLFPKTATVACQGVEGAYSQLAGEKLFRLPGIINGDSGIGNGPCPQRRCNIDLQTACIYLIRLLGFYRKITHEKSLIYCLSNSI